MRIERITEWINNTAKYHQHYYNENPRVKKIRENIEREERRRFDYNNLMGGENNVIKSGLDFEEAMKCLEERMNLRYGSFEELNPGSYLVGTGEWQHNEKAIFEFNKVYGEYCACGFMDGHYLFTNNSNQEKDIMDAFKRLMKNTDVDLWR